MRDASPDLDGEQQSADLWSIGTIMKLIGTTVEHYLK